MVCFQIIQLSVGINSSRCLTSEMKKKKPNKPNNKPEKKPESQLLCLSQSVIINV